MADIDEKLKAEALDWLVSLRGTAEKAQGFVLDQAPEALRELATVGRFEWTCAVVAGLVAMPIGYALFRKVYVAEWETLEQGDRYALKFISSIGCLSITLCGLLAVGANFHAFATAWFAPRIYILETLAELAGKAAGK